MNYAIAGAGSVGGSANGANVLALTAGNTHALRINTATPGVHAGTISASSSSEAVANGTFNQGISTTVLAHATPSFSDTSQLSVTTIDFGIRGLDLAYALLDNYRAAILVDAVARGGTPGTLYLMDLSTAESSPDPAAVMDPHGMHPARVLELARSLGEPVRPILLVGCEPQPIDESYVLDGLSLRVMASINAAADIVLDCASQLLHEHDSPLESDFQPLAGDGK